MNEIKVGYGGAIGWRLVEYNHSTCVNQPPKLEIIPFLVKV